MVLGTSALASLLTLSFGVEVPGRNDSVEMTLLFRMVEEGPVPVGARRETFWSVHAPTLFVG